MHLLIRMTVCFPRFIKFAGGLFTTPVAYATAHGGTLHHFSYGVMGVSRRDAARETRRAILAGIRNNSIGITHKTTVKNITAKTTKSYSHSAAPQSAA